MAVIVLLGCEVQALVRAGYHRRRLRQVVPVVALAEFPDGAVEKA
jgi:hypothetical protein